MTSVIVGAKGGGSKPRPPVESPDSLHSISYARILDLVSEGEIEGLVDGDSSVFLDETPLSDSGSSNFSGVTLDTREGTQEQEYIKGFPAVENEIAIGVVLSANTPWVRAVNNSQLSAVRVRLSVPTLLQQNTTTGDTTGYTVQYEIDVATDGGAYQTVLSSAFRGKTTTKYERSHRLDLPAGSSWSVRVRRLTADSATGSIQDTVRVESITEIIDAKFRYPNSAIVALQFDASQFSSIPRRSYHLRGRIIKVPVNYDPVARTYSGVWDGTFKLAYTNNPAWIYYDLLLNDRYGLGHMLNALQVDKWALYQVGQYCDVMVPDGKGGTEPRFTCNVYLQTKADALRVLQDLASVFRGISYYGAGQVITSADMPDDPTYTYTNANVIDGKFVYAGSGRKSRYSTVLVSWNDPSDFYRAKVEYVENRDALQRYGFRQMEMTAFGCSSQGQAQRAGNWALLTNMTETETVSFSVGLDGTLIRPGKIVRVADNRRAGRRIGGRIRSSTLSSLVLDADVQAYKGDSITVIMPNGTAVTRSIASVGIPVNWDNGTITWDDGTTTMDAESFPQDVQNVTLDTPLGDLPPTHSIWAIESASLKTQTFRILSIKENFSGGKIQFDVTATKHNVSKHSAIDNGTKIDTPPITVIPPSIQPPPENIVVSSETLVDQGLSVSTLLATWDPVPRAIAYEVQWRRDDSDWVIAGRTGTTSLSVPNIYSGRYVVRVRSINALDISSVWATSTETVLNGKTTPPPVVSSLTASGVVFGINLAWTIPADVSTADLQRTELWYGSTNVLGSALKLGDFPYPQVSHSLIGLAAGQTLYFWARLVDRSGNVGSYYGPVQGQASSDASQILQYLVEQIQETHLSQALLSNIATPADVSAVSAAITSEESARVAGDASLTSQVNTAQSTAVAAQNTADGKVKSFLQTTAPASGMGTGDLWFDSDDNNKAYRYSGSAWVAIDDARLALNAAAIANEATTRADQDGALASQISTVQAIADAKIKTYRQTTAPASGMAAGDLWFDSDDNNKAYRYSGSAWVATDDTRIGTTEATVQTHSTAIAEIDGDLAAMYTIKTQVSAGGKTYLAGIGIGVDNGSGILESQVLVTADKFAVLNVSNGVVTSPFAIVAGVVYMSAAMIQDGTITNAKIGNTIQSTNYIAGQQGWKLDKNGNLLELNGTLGGTGRLSITNQTVEVFDSVGTRRVRLGVWS